MGAQECTQIGGNGPSGPFWGVCVHCWAVGLGCGWPWDRNSVHKWEDRASPRRFGAFVYTVAPREDRANDRGDAGVYTDWLKWPLRAVLGRLCTLLHRCGQTRRCRSVHRLAKTAPRRRFGAFVYTVAPRAASGGTSGSTTMVCRRRPLGGRLFLVGNRFCATGSARAALPAARLAFSLRRQPTQASEKAS